MPRAMMRNRKPMVPVFSMINLAALFTLVAFLAAPSAASVQATTGMTQTAPGIGQAASSIGKDRKAERARISQELMRIPLHFVPNQGQKDPGVRSLARGKGFSLFFLPTKIVMAVGTSDPDRILTVTGTPEEEDRIHVEIQVTHASGKRKVRELSLGGPMRLIRERTTILALFTLFSFIRDECGGLEKS